MLPRHLQEFIREFSRLPGIGYKTSERLGFYILSQPVEFAESVGRAVLDLKNGSRTCEECGAVSDSDDCVFCGDGSRDRGMICVVENAMDVFYVESTQSYHGLYHVLGGVISPLNGVTPKDLKIDGLLERAGRLKITELLFATSPTTEGDTTALYIQSLVKDRNIRVTHLARGIPVGTDLQYAGSSSLSQAIKNREEIK